MDQEEHDITVGGLRRGYYERTEIIGEEQAKWQITTIISATASTRATTAAQLPSLLGTNARSTAARHHHNATLGPCPRSRRETVHRHVRDMYVFYMFFVNLKIDFFDVICFVI